MLRSLQQIKRLLMMLLFRNENLMTKAVSGSFVLNATLLLWSHKMAVHLPFRFALRTKSFAIFSGLIQLSFLAVLCMSTATVKAIDLPDIGTSADQVFSPLEELALGEAFVRQLRQRVTLLDDIEIENYLNALGYRLASYSDNPSQSFSFFAIHDDSINAFAVPGGFIGIHSGLILHTRDESELASVLAHEIAHVTQRHIARTVEGVSKFSIASAAVLLASILLASKNPEVAQAGVAVATASNVQMQIDFTRAHEKEADRVGMQVLAKAGFNPSSMPDFFAALQASTRLYEGGMPEFLRTHPVTTNRIAEARDRAATLPKPKITDSSMEYHLVRAKVLVLTTADHPALLKRLQNALKTGHYREPRAVHYALALLGLRLNEAQLVKEHLTWLQENDSDRVMYRLLVIRLALLQNNLNLAAEHCQKALELYPGDRQLVQTYADILLEQQQAGRAEQLLQELRAPHSPAYYRQLAQVQKANGKAGEALLSLAEYYYLNGQTGAAVEQLKQAQQLPNLDFYLRSRIEARQKKWEAELLEEKQANAK